jgi:hypothetical protein
MIRRNHQPITEFHWRAERKNSCGNRKFSRQASAIVTTDVIGDVHDA